MELNLLPQPRNVRILHGIHALRRGLRLLVHPDGGTPAIICARELAAALGGAGIPADIARTGAPARSGDIVLDIQADPARPEAYELRVTPKCVAARAAGRPGLLHAMRTLLQVLRSCGARLPCCVIKDEPCFKHRALYLDVTRGKVPTLESLKRTVDRMAALKMNQLQLYVEHVFDFRFDPAIAAGCDPLTATELVLLDTYARDRAVELVPSLACFGHMGRVLSLPAYKRFAEVEWSAPDWEHCGWRPRLRGATINPRSPGAKRLLRNMLEEFLPLFASGKVNICGDETYDLGRGRNRRFAQRVGIDRLYLDHISFLRSVAAENGKRLMFWGDVMLQYPCSIRDVPRDCTVLDWGYEADTRFEKAAAFTERGLETYVCPSTRGYQAVFNRVDTAEANITGYARTGARLGAAGLMVTDWGDMGHFNMRTCSLHGIARAAAAAWNPADRGDGFDRAFGTQVLGDRSGRLVRVFRRAGRAPAASWPFLQDDMAKPAYAPPSAADTRRTLRAVPAILTDLSSVNAESLLLEPFEFDEIVLGCTALAMTAEKAAILAGIETDGPNAEWRGRCRNLSKDLRDFATRYRVTWLAGNKRSRVDEVCRSLQRLSRALQRL